MTNFLPSNRQNSWYCHWYYLNLLKNWCMLHLNSCWLLLAIFLFSCMYCQFWNFLRIFHHWLVSKLCLLLWFRNQHRLKIEPNYSGQFEMISRPRWPLCENTTFLQLSCSYACFATTSNGHWLLPNPQNTMLAPKLKFYFLKIQYLVRKSYYKLKKWGLLRTPRPRLAWRYCSILPIWPSFKKPLILFSGSIWAFDIFLTPGTERSDYFC